MVKSEEMNVDFEKSIGPWLGRTMKLVDYHMNESFANADLDLTKEQMVVLKKLSKKDGLNQNELAFLTYRDKSSLARLLLKMERKKYIRREQSADDKRAKKVFLTKTGKTIYSQTRPIIKSLIDKMEHNISFEDKERMISVLKKVQINFEPELTFKK